MWKYSPNSRCRPSSCLLAVLTMFFANGSPTLLTRETREMCRHFVVTTKTTQPRPQVVSVNGSIILQFCCTIDVIFTYRKILPNLEFLLRRLTSRVTWLLEWKKKVSTILVMALRSIKVHHK